MAVGRVCSADAETERVARTILGSTQEVGAVAETLVSASDYASRHRTKACGIIVTGCVLHSTGICNGAGIGSPSCSTCQRLSNLGVVTTTHILALATHIVS